MNPTLVACVVLAGITSARAARGLEPSVGGTWNGHTKSAVCQQCEIWISLELSETSTGNLRGVLMSGTSSAIDFSSGAAYVLGTRGGDSISLVATIPCDSARGPRPRLRLTYRGKVWPRGDTVSGAFIYRLSRDTVRIPMTLSRASIDSSIVDEFRKLRLGCAAA
jgi:hypothetical protein